MPGLPSDWSALTAEHAAAIRQFAEAARQLSAERWGHPLAPGKWSPAEVTGHLTEAYLVLTGELAGAGGMRLLGPPLQRFILRYTLLPRLLASGRFPPNARAPAEIRPRQVAAGPEQGIAACSRQAEEFITALAERATAGPVRLTHAYFGPLNLRQALRLSAVHTRPHARQLEAFTQLG